MSRPFSVLTCEQRSDEWRVARLGRVTSSRADDMLSKGRGSNESAGRRNLRTELVLERITEKPHERNFQSWAMKQGVETEPEAVAVYEALSGRLVERPGFVRHDALMAGGSPDGVIGAFDGLIEIKAPISAIHLEYLKSGQVPLGYLRQVTHLLWLTGAAWCDWFSYDPSFPDPLKAKLVRVEAKDLDLAGYERELQAFLREVDRGVAEVRALMEAAA